MLNHQKQTVCNSCKEYQYVSSGQVNKSLEVPGDDQENMDSLEIKISNQKRNCLIYTKEKNLQLVVTLV